MTAVTGSCPNCGAPLTFTYPQCVQTTCVFCKSIVVRRDVNLEKVGTVAEVPNNSPIQLATEGVWRGKAFTVTGRIIYDWEQGTWNEWHVVLTGGASAWLSDAQNEYAVSTLLNTPPAVPLEEKVARGQHVTLGDTRYEVTTITRARYRGVEGELPFEYWDKTEAVFADLRSTGGAFATIDYSEQPPLVFTGEAVESADLRLRNLRQFEGW